MSHTHDCWKCGASFPCAAPTLVAQGDWQAVHDHCLSDIGLTHTVANFCEVLEL